ncbi:DUF695 domain-containing protein [Chryseobacterium sp.]|uniref:DUF695 domain-containing protein n=1 Tax=Chryseobacterium sp. TaxID=1871047 RepID=UPI00388F5160
MTWEEIKLDQNSVYPKNEITEFVMEVDNGNLETHWVDKAYAHYAHKKNCKYNFLVLIDVTDEYNSKKDNHDIIKIEKYFDKKLKAACVCHFVARITTDNGMNLEFYIDDVQSAINVLNDIKRNNNRLVDFNCDITDDENWTNVEELFS